MASTAGASAGAGSSDGGRGRNERRIKNTRATSAVQARATIAAMIARRRVMGGFHHEGTKDTKTQMGLNIISFLCVFLGVLCAFVVKSRLPTHAGPVPIS